MVRSFLFTCLSAITLMSVAQHTLPPEVEQVVSTRIAEGIYPGICIGIVDGDGSVYYSYGVTKTGGEPINEQSVFEIGSITKAFTGILLADLHLKGQVSIEDPVQTLLPGEVRMPVRRDREITAGHLAAHTSALPRLPSNMAPANPMDPYVDYTAQQMYDFLNAHTLARDIGEKYEYSNLGYGLLGHVLSRKAGMAYEELVVKTISGPLAMHDTRITLTTQMRQRLAYPHSRGLEVPMWEFGSMAGLGALRSTARDMLKFCAANLGHTGGALHEALDLSHQVRHTQPGVRVGLGWHIEKGKDGDIIWHNGGTGGYRAFTGFVKATGRGVVVLVNSDIGADDIGFYLLGAGALQNVKPHVINVLRKHIDAHGPAEVEQLFVQLRESAKDKYDFGEIEINTLGYHYLGAGQADAALALFRINTMEHPASSNVWDSYGEALLAKGDTAAAIENYLLSVRLNPGNTAAIRLLESLGVDTGVHIVRVNAELLQSYVGTYELVPGFNIDITAEGENIHGQATGQSKFEMFAKSETEFYLKVVDAQIKFNKNDAGEVVSLTLFQGGQILEGKRQ